MDLLDDRFTTSGALAPAIDKKMIILLRDGRKLIGVLRSYDQFANLVLMDATERVYVGNQYGDIPRGIFVIRGENVVLLAEVDLDLEDDVPLQRVPIEEILVLQRDELEKKSLIEKRRNEILHSQGFSTEVVEGDQY